MLCASSSTRWKSQSPSLRGSGRFKNHFLNAPLAARRLNPLHCGAVVASAEALVKRLRHILVSIPFIAGQWSLQFDAEALVKRLRHMSQSPSLRGSGRFIADRFPEFVGAVVSQSPSLRGSGRFREPRCGRPTAARPVSIPFIAGQWSLPRAALPRRTRGLRVSIPFIAGQWSLHPEGDYPVYRCIKVSIPFIAGQWSLRRRRAGFRRQERGLNPLHCGAVVASEASTVIMELQALFQSPSLRGSGRFPLPLRQCHSSC